MNTNEVQVITQIATAHGWSLSGTQITVLLAIGATFVRYLRLETVLAVKTWGEAGGWQGLKNFFRTGNSVSIETMIANADKQLSKPSTISPDIRPVEAQKTNEPAANGIIGPTPPAN